MGYLRMFPVILIVSATAVFGQNPDSSPLQDLPDPEKSMSFQWEPAVLESLLAATIANAERFTNEQGTRDALHGAFVKDYLHDIESFHG